MMDTERLTRWNDKTESAELVGYDKKRMGGFCKKNR